MRPTPPLRRDLMKLLEEVREDARAAQEESGKRIASLEKQLQDEREECRAELTLLRDRIRDLEGRLGVQSDSISG